MNDLKLSDGTTFYDNSQGLLRNPTAPGNPSKVVNPDGVLDFCVYIVLHMLNRTLTTEAPRELGRMVTAKELSLDTTTTTILESLTRNNALMDKTLSTIGVFLAVIYYGFFIKSQIKPQLKYFTLLYSTNDFNTIRRVYRYLMIKRYGANWLKVLIDREYTNEAHPARAIAANIKL